MRRKKAKGLKKPNIRYFKILLSLIEADQLIKKMKVSR